MPNDYQQLAYNHTFVKKNRRLFKKPLFWGSSFMATSNPKADSESARKTALEEGLKHIYMASIADFRPNIRGVRSNFFDYTEKQRPKIEICYYK